MTTFLTRITLSRCALTAAMICGAALSAASQEKVPSGQLSLELNTLAPSEAGCMATFMVKNELTTPLDQVAFEVVLFNTEGLVDRLMVLDFSPLDTAKTRVRQFDLPQTSCDSISRILINDAASCKGEGIVASTCIENLLTISRPGIEFGS